MATAARTARPRKTTRAKPAPEPVSELPEQDELALFTVDGLAVVESHRMQNLPNAPMNLVKLTLEDGSIRYQCADCPDIVGGREDIRTHRRVYHPLPKDPSRLPAVIMNMTIAQLIASAESSLNAGALVERIEGERDRYRQELAEMTKKYKALTKALERVGFKLEDE